MTRRKKPRVDPIVQRLIRNGVVIVEDGDTYRYIGTQEFIFVCIDSAWIDCKTKKGED